MRKIGLFNIGRLGLVKSAGTGKTDINKVIEKWIPKHMVFWYDVQKQGATNEILKANPYLQDFSGNNRPLKLNNFLFAAMSGVGGYSLNAKSYHNRASTLEGTFNDYSVVITAKVKDVLGLVWTENGIGDSNSVAVGKSLTRPAFTVTVEGMPDDLKWGLWEENATNKGNGTFEIPAYTYTNTTETTQAKFIGISFSKSTFDNVNIKFTFQPLYPNALVTDGVDDYGVVENLQQGVKVLFYTCNPFSLNKIFYDQTKQGWRKFNIYNKADKIAYNERNENGVTYIDGNLNSLLLANDLVNKKQIITIVNEGSDANNTISPIYFSVNQHNGYFANLAFYNSIGFDSVPTQQTDGFTEQDLIDYYIPKAIVTITVVDVSGSPIQDAVVTVGGIQYKTLSDGTVKVRGMANGTMSLSVKKDGYMPFSDNSWKLADSRITLEVLRNTVITENGYSILLENDGLILTE